MARDRQRRKDRQRARAAGDQPTPRKRDRSRAPDDEQPVDGTPADTTPDELEGATPYADEARLAESGAAVPPPTDDADDNLYGGEPDFDRADDEVEIPRDLVAPSESERLPHDDKPRGRVLTFLRACVDELRRVQWPDRKHVFSATAVVLGFVLIAGSYLGLMDAIWQPLINALL